MHSTLINCKKHGDEDERERCASDAHCGAADAEGYGRSKRDGFCRRPGEIGQAYAVHGTATAQRTATR